MYHQRMRCEVRYAEEDFVDVAASNHADDTVS